MEQKEKLLLSEEINSHVTDHVMAGIEEIAGQRGEHYFRVWINQNDTHVLINKLNALVFCVKHRRCSKSRGMSIMPGMDKSALVIDILM